MRLGHRLMLAASATALASAAMAAETTIYTYDALGRLMATSSSGSVNNGLATSVGYDPAGNRTGYGVGGVGGIPPPSSVASATSGNQPPVAAADSGEMPRCRFQADFHPLDNDHDPDGNTPLSLVSASYSGPLGTVFDSNPKIVFRPNGSGTGTAAITYIVQDSVGATATGSFNLAVVQGQC